MAVAARETSAMNEQTRASAFGAENHVAPDPRFAAPECLFFGIGAQKSGTTWLHSYLARHPEVHVPRYYKELNYWCSACPSELERALETLYGLRPERTLMFLAGAGKKPPFLREFRSRLNRVRFFQKWERSLSSESQDHAHYADVLFHGLQDQACTGEISPSYALLEEGKFAEMTALSDNARFIFLMRDPVARMWSGCRHELRTVLGRAGTTNDAMVERVQSGLASPDDLAVKRSRYDQTIRTLESVVPKSRIAYFFYETLFQQSEIDRLCAFLGIAPCAADFDRRVNVKEDASGKIPPDVARQARETLAATYEFCRAKFGTLPPGWQDVTVTGDA